MPNGQAFGSVTAAVLGVGRWCRGGVGTSPGCSVIVGLIARRVSPAVATPDPQSVTEGLRPVTLRAPVVATAHHYPRRDREVRGGSCGAAGNEVRASDVPHTVAVTLQAQGDGGLLPPGPHRTRIARLVFLGGVPAGQRVICGARYWD